MLLTAKVIDNQMEGTELDTTDKSTMLESFQKIDQHELRNQIDYQARFNPEMKNFSMKPEHRIMIVALAYWYASYETYDVTVKFLKAQFGENDHATYRELMECLQVFQPVIESLSRQYKRMELKAAALSLPIGDESRADSMIETPKGLRQLALSLLDVQDDDTILDMGAGSYSFLIDADALGKKTNLIGVDINIASHFIGSIRSAMLCEPQYFEGEFFCEKRIDVLTGDALDLDLEQYHANKVFANMPLGQKLSYMGHISGVVPSFGNEKLNKFFQDTKRATNGDWVYTVNAGIAQKDGGKSVIVTTGGCLFNVIDKEVRERLLNTGKIEGVISLCSRLLPSSGISLNLIILSNGNKSVKMIDATEIFTKGRRMNTLESSDVNKILELYREGGEGAVIIDNNEIARQDYSLFPSRYQLDAKIDFDGIALGDIIKGVNRGASIRAKDLDAMTSKTPTQYQYLMLQDINDGQVSENLHYLKEVDEKYKRCFLSNGDLIMSKLAPFKMAVVRKSDERKILANGNLYFMSIDPEKMNPYYVMLFLNSEQGRMQLMDLAKGAAMVTISAKDLETVQIPKMPLDEQNKIAEQYLDFCDQLTALKRQRENICEKINNLVGEVN